MIAVSELMTLLYPLRNRHRVGTTTSSQAVRPCYWTRRGVMYAGPAEEALCSDDLARYRGKIQPIFTSPPFPLNRKKSYGNLQGEYVKWLVDFAPRFGMLTATARW